MSKLVKIDEIDSSNDYVICFGNFDGVHLGHINCFNELIVSAKENQAKSLVITFNPHTLEMIKPEYSNYQISSNGLKNKCILNANIDYLVNIEFNSTVLNKSASEFIDFLIKKIKPKIIYIGYDNQFGKNKEGNLSFLKNYLNHSNIKVKEFSLFKYNNNTIVKSSLIRNYILKGEFGIVKSLLNRGYIIEGIIIKGRGKGKKIGFPTANIKLISRKSIIPKDGVYVTKISFDDFKFNSLSNIGFRPTFNSLENDKSIETYILDDREHNLYGKNVKIEFLEFLRKEIKFKTVNELVVQIKQDIEELKNRSYYGKGC